MRIALVGICHDARRLPDTWASFYRYPEQLDPDAEPHVLKGVGRLSVDDRARIRVLDTNQMKTK
jgi:hypothetical protein